MLKGVADIGFGTSGTVGGQFRKTEVSTLPFETDNVRENAVALWGYKGYLEDRRPNSMGDPYQIASQILPFVILGGFFFHLTGLINIGIACYAILMVFQLVTLPVEFDASRRAMVQVRELGLVSEGERGGAAHAA